MAARHDGGWVGQIGRLFERGTVAGLGDEQILERFAVHRDGAAFEALVNRHGSTVLGVCRRFLRDPNDVEDAFQATFVILARKAAGLRDREALGPWLHGVAYRVASRARTEAAKRRLREAPDERAIAEALAPETSRADLAWLLDEEILRLPEKLRWPVVLCLIEGQTYDEAAGQLRWTPAMVRGRLAEARARLRDRLIRRGEAPTVASALLGLKPVAVPASLATSAANLTTRAVAGNIVASSASGLADRTIRSWLMNRLATAALVLVAGGVAAGVGASSVRLLAEGRNAPKAAPAVRVVAQGPAKAEASAQKPPANRRRGAGDPETHRVSLEGRALDSEGKPVAGASIVVANANRMIQGDPVLARGVSGLDGRFLLQDVPLKVLDPEPGPIPKPAEARFEVSGSAPGLAFAWHPVQSYRPTPRTNKNEAKDDHVFHPGDPIRADLVFEAPAKVHGRVIDDQGNPVVGAKVQFGYVDSTRNPEGSGSWLCASINPTGGDEVSFNGVGLLPESVRSARTDADGRYSVDSLPREAKLLAQIDHDLTVDPLTITIATSAMAFPDTKSVGHDGVLDHTFVMPRKVTIRVLHADTSQPAPGVRVVAQGEKMRRAGAVGTTDAQGTANLALPEGSYTLRAEPPLKMAYRISEQPLVIGDAPAPEGVVMNLEPASTVVLEAVDADTGRGLAGIGFEAADETSASREGVRSHAGFVDHPVTDDSGRLSAVIEPGRLRFFPSEIPRDYEASTRASEAITLEPGKTASARFAFKKRPEPAPEPGQPREDEVGKKFRETWNTQRGLLARGRMRATRTYQPGEGIAPDRLRKLLESLDPDKVPPILDLIRENFPDAPPASTGYLEITADGYRHRETRVWKPDAKPSSANVVVNNGKETVYYNPGNAQVNIGDHGPKSRTRMAAAGLVDFCSWPGWAGKVTGLANGRITFESKPDVVEPRVATTDSRIIADEATGFVFRYSLSWTNYPGSDVWQFAPRVVAGGAIVPSLSVEVNRSEDKINMIWIKTIESVDIVSPVPPETFLVAVAPGTQILDDREGGVDNYRGVARWPIADVVAKADADPRRHKPFVPPVKAGDVAPPLDALAWLAPGGKKIDAPSLKGKVAMMDFWGIDCGFCIAQFPEVREAFDHFQNQPRGKDLVLIGLHDSSSTVEGVAAFAAKRGLSWTLAVDRPGEGFGATFTAYGVRSIPAAAVIDRRGRIAYIGRFREALAIAAKLLEED